MDSRFSEVMTAHWPVFALLAGLALVMTVIALVRGRHTEEVCVPGGVIFGWGMCLCPAACGLRLGIGFGVECGVGHL